MRLHYVLALMVSIVVAAPGCQSNSRVIRDLGVSEIEHLEGASLPREQALEYMRFVEEQPLAGEAQQRRRLAFEWLVAAKELKGVAFDASLIEPLNGSSYVFNGELMMQYFFGHAMWALSPQASGADPQSGAEAGLRSMIAAYRNIVQLDAKLREPWLEWLDRMRREGRLRTYVDSVMALRR